MSIRNFLGVLFLINSIGKAVFNHNHTKLQLPLSLYQKQKIKNFCNDRIIKPKLADVIEFMKDVTIKKGSIKTFLNSLYKISRNDAKDLLNILLGVKARIPNYYLSYSKTNDEILNSLFWASDKMKYNYSKYGDVVLFDTTFKTNRFRMPLGIFVGMSAYGKNIFYGMVIIHDESFESFQWTFKQFLACHKTEPETFICDEDSSIIKAAKDVFRKSKINICEWHKEGNFKKNLSHLKKSEETKDVLQQMIALITSTGDFETKFNKIIEQLQKTNQIKALEYVNLQNKNKHLWARQFTEVAFTLNIHTTSRSESTNSTLKGILNFNSNVALTQLWVVLDKLEDHNFMVQERYLSRDILNITSKNSLIMKLSEILTPYSLDRVIDEFILASNYRSVFKNNIYEVSRIQNTNKRNIFVSEGKLTCTCPTSISMRLPCRHIICVFLSTELDMKILYCDKRWYLKQEISKLYHMNSTISEEFTKLTVNDNENSIQSNLTYEMPSETNNLPNLSTSLQLERLNSACVLLRENENAFKDKLLFSQNSDNNIDEVVNEEAEDLEEDENIRLHNTEAGDFKNIQDPHPVKTKGRPTKAKRTKGVLESTY